MRNEIGIPPLTPDELERGCRETTSDAEPAQTVKISRILPPPVAVTSRAAMSASEVVTPEAPLRREPKPRPRPVDANAIRQHLIDVEASLHHDDRPHRVLSQGSSSSGVIDSDATWWDSGIAWIAASIVALVGVFFIVTFVFQHQP